MKRCSWAPPESTHIFTFAQNGGDGVKQVPTQAFNIHPDNIIKVLVTIGNDWYPFSVPSAFLRLLGTTAKPTGVSANDRATSTTDKVVLDCDGRDILLMRAPDNTIIVASPTANLTATIRFYEVGGIAGRAGQQAIDSRAPRVDWFWRSVAGGATPTFAGQFDGATWRNLGTWRRFPVTGSLGAGEAYWYARARSVYNPASTFDWNSSGVVYPAASARFSRSEFPTTPAHILSAPPAGGSDYYVQYYLGGGQWSPFSLVVGAPHGLDLIASSNWHPDSRTARIHWDTAFTRFDTLKGIHVELGLYNQFLDQFLESEVVLLPRRLAGLAGEERAAGAAAARIGAGFQPPDPPAAVRGVLRADHDVADAGPRGGQLLAGRLRLGAGVRQRDGRPHGLRVRQAGGLLSGDLQRGAAAAVRDQDQAGAAVSYIAYDATDIGGTGWHRITHVWPTLAEITAYAGNDVRAESSKDVYRDVGEALVGWFTQPTNAHSVASNLPADNSAAAQRIEIKDILRLQLLMFRPGAFPSAAIEAAHGYVKMVLAFTAASTTDDQLDACKTAARADLDEFGAYAESEWGDLTSTPGLYVWSRESAAALPAAAGGDAGGDEGGDRCGQHRARAIGLGWAAASRSESGCGDGRPARPEAVRPNGQCAGVRDSRATEMRFESAHREPGRCYSSISAMIRACASNCGAVNSPSFSAMMRENIPIRCSPSFWVFSTSPLRCPPLATWPKCIMTLAGSSIPSGSRQRTAKNSADVAMSR